MPEEIEKVEAVKVDFKCPKCETGYLRPNGIAYATNPMQYPHICNNMKCDYKDTFYRNYPFIDYREIN